MLVLYEMNFKAFLTNFSKGNFLLLLKRVFYQLEILKLKILVLHGSFALAGLFLPFGIEHQKWRTICGPKVNINQ